MVDFGAHSLQPTDDYPDLVIPLARYVAAGKVDRGIAICGSGVGVSIAANKIHGARAALILDHFSARQGVEDDHMNIICLGGRVVGPATAWELVQAFLAAEYSNAERHRTPSSERCDRVWLSTLLTLHSHWRRKTHSRLASGMNAN